MAVGRHRLLFETGLEGGWRSTYRIPVQQQYQYLQSTSTSTTAVPVQRISCWFERLSSNCSWIGQNHSGAEWNHEVPHDKVTL